MAPRRTDRSPALRTSHSPCPPGDTGNDPPVLRFEPRSDAQHAVRQAYAECDLVFVLGSAGAGKTTCAVGLAVLDVLGGKSRRDRVVVLRPALQADAPLGFLEGSLEDKLAPYATPVWQALGKVCFRPPPGLLAVEALGYVRGVTFEHCVVVLDEAQNCTLPQLRLVLSRLGRGSKLLVCGDPEQSDLPRPPRSSPACPPPPCPLEQAASALEGVEGVRVVRLPPGECHRHPLVATALARLRGL